MNRKATAHYLRELMNLQAGAVDKPPPNLELWAQCDGNNFSIVVRRVDANEGDPPYITVDYYVPTNRGQYRGAPPPDFTRYPTEAAQGFKWPAVVPEEVISVDEGFNAKRFLYSRAPAAADLLKRAARADASVKRQLVAAAVASAAIEAAAKAAQP